MNVAFRCVRRGAALLVAVALAAGAAGCGQRQGGAAAGGGRGPVVFPVETQPVAARAVEYSVHAVGSVEAFERVEVTARVAGVVERVRFAEGDLVAAAAVLAEVEPERYKLSLEASRASLAKAEAGLADAEAGLARRESINAKNPDLVRAEDVDAWRTRVRVATADREAARAAQALAELNLRDAFVKAPVAGVIQTRSVQTGQFVQVGAVLATLLRREPLLLRFGVPEPEAARLRPGLAARFTVRGSSSPFEAEISHVADAAEAVSRMVAVTARVIDPRRAELRAGAFAEVTVPVGVAAQAPVIPQTAIRPTERGFLAFVVEGDEAKERILTLGLRTAEGLVEVRGGLAAGESLVVRGAEALSDGAKVRAGAGAEDARQPSAEREKAR